MGTYTESKYRKARREFVCRHCEGSIEKGDKYLSYALGQRNRISICEDCSKRRDVFGYLYYECAAVCEELGLRREKA